MNHCSILAGRPDMAKRFVKKALPRADAPGRTYNRAVRVLRYAAAALPVFVVIGALRLISVTSAAACAPLLLLNVVVAARWWGTGPALFAAGTGAAAYSYFVLPPSGFGIDDP